MSNESVGMCRRAYLQREFLGT